MKTPCRIPLNPCDNCIYGHHRFLASRNRGENIAFMSIEFANRLDPAVVKRALASVMRLHPVILGSIRTSLWRFRPFWNVPAATSEVAAAAADRAFRYEDLRADHDGLARFDTFKPDWTSSDGPQVRLEHHDLPGDRTRLVLRWPHYFMDAEGAQSLLAELEARRESDSAASAIPDRPVSIFPQATLLDRLRFISRGWSQRPSRVQSIVRHLPQSDQDRIDGYRVLHRCWSGGDFDRFLGIARTMTPVGPARYGRHLAGAVVRALDRIYRDERVETGVYSITFPLRVRRFGGKEDASFQRPLFGNYLVTPTLRIQRERVSDAAALAQDISSQLRHFLDCKGDASQWALLEAASWIHALFYPLIFRFPFAAGAYSSGFSYYSAFPFRLRTLPGAKVTNLWGGGPIATPPGWNPVFSRYGDCLNLSLTWTRPAVTDELATRYASYIEEYMFASDDSPRRL